MYKINKITGISCILYRFVHASPWFVLRTWLILALTQHLELVSWRRAVLAAFSDLFAVSWLLVFQVVSLLSHLRRDVLLTPVEHRETVADARERGLCGEDDVEQHATAWTTK